MNPVSFASPSPVSFAARFRSAPARPLFASEGDVFQPVHFGIRSGERTNRDSYYLMQHMGYPRDFVDPEKLKDKTVVDLCCGGGAFVEEMSGAGVNIVGVDKDLALIREEHPEWAANRNTGLFREADAASLPFEDGSVDLVYCSNGVLSFGDFSNEYKVEVLKELHRILKPGGKIRAGDLPPDIIARLLPQVPGLQETGRTDPALYDYGDPQYIEITKIRN